jgi:hypothetical protein
MEISRTQSEHTQSYMNESDEESKTYSKHKTYYRELLSRTATSDDEFTICREKNLPAPGQQ